MEKSEFPNGNVSKLTVDELLQQIQKLRRIVAADTKMTLNCCRYQNDLPKKIKSRGKEGHVTHEELVQTIKWKLAVRRLILIIFKIIFIFKFK